MKIDPLHCCCVVLLLAGSIGTAAGQTVYRCTGGYSQEPCPGGSRLETADPRSHAQQLQSAEVARRDAQLADRMEADRLKQEARAPSATIPASKAPLPAAPTKKGDAAAKKKTGNPPGVFTATVPGSGKNKAPKKSAKEA